MSYLKSDQTTYCIVLNHLKQDAMKKIETSLIFLKSILILGMPSLCLCVNVWFCHFKNVIIYLQSKKKDSDWFILYSYLAFFGTVYVDMGNVATDTTTLAFTFTTTSTTRLWEIKVSQISCSNTNRLVMIWFSVYNLHVITFN